MKHISFLLLITLLIATMSGVNAEIIVHEFYQTTCPHCQNVIASGVLEKADAREDVTVQTYETTTPGGFRAYEEMQKRVKLPQGVPLVVIECEEEGFITLIGDTPIINNLDTSIDRCYTGDYDSGGSSNLLYFIIFVAIIGGLYYYFFHYKKK